MIARSSASWSWFRTAAVTALAASLTACQGSVSADGDLTRRPCGRRRAVTGARRRVAARHAHVRARPGRSCCGSFAGSGSAAPRPPSPLELIWHGLNLTGSDGTRSPALPVVSGSPDSRYFALPHARRPPDPDRAGRSAGRLGGPAWMLAACHDYGAASRSVREDACCRPG